MNRPSHELTLLGLVRPIDGTIQYEVLQYIEHLEEGFHRHKRYRERYADEKKVLREINLALEAEVERLRAELYERTMAHQAAEYGLLKPWGPTNSELFREATSRLRNIGRWREVLPAMLDGHPALLQDYIKLLDDILDDILDEAMTTKY